VLKGTKAPVFPWDLEPGDRRSVLQTSRSRLCKPQDLRTRAAKATQMDTNTLLIILIVIFLVGGGGWYGRGRWF
jgi:hypothetical protein